MDEYTRINIVQICKDELITGGQKCTWKTDCFPCVNWVIDDSTTSRTHIRIILILTQEIHEVHKEPFFTIHSPDTWVRTYSKSTNQTETKNKMYLLKNIIQ